MARKDRNLDRWRGSLLDAQPKRRVDWFRRVFEFYGEKFHPRNAKKVLSALQADINMVLPPPPAKKRGRQRKGWGERVEAHAAVCCHISAGARPTDAFKLAAKELKKEWRTVKTHYYRVERTRGA